MVWQHLRRGAEEELAGGGRERSKASYRRRRDAKIGVVIGGFRHKEVGWSQKRPKITFNVNRRRVEARDSKVAAKGGGAICFFFLMIFENERRRR